MILNTDRQTPQKSRFYIRFTLALLAIVVVVAGCSDYSTQSYPSQRAEVTVDLQRPSLMLQQAIGRVDLIVLRPQAGMEQAAYEVLTDSGGIFSVVIDSLPAAERLLFVMTAWDAETLEIPLYADTVFVTLIPEELNPVNMTLVPVQPMLRVRPRFHSQTTTNTFALEVRVDNIPSLYGLSFRVYYDSFLMSIDSVSSLLAGAEDLIVARQIDSAFTGQGAWAIGATATPSSGAIVDGSGGGGLVRLHCRAVIQQPWEVTDTARVWLEVTDGVYADSTSLPIQSVYTDDGLVEFPGEF
ncbi:hypothetical protein GF356_08735 [candidate division GN15 bacterium]|nr:hypothetical protein [candidate division GN15 bacterium]